VTRFNNLRIASEAGTCCIRILLKSTAIYGGITKPPEYPFHDRTIQVTQCGRICIRKRKINLSTVFGGQLVGIREVEDKIWQVSFMEYDLGFFDEDENRVEPASNPFTPKVLPMSSV